MRESTSHYTYDPQVTFSLFFFPLVCLSGMNTPAQGSVRGIKLWISRGGALIQH